MTNEITIRGLPKPPDGFQERDKYPVRIAYSGELYWNWYTNRWHVADSPITPKFSIAVPEQLCGARFLHSLLEEYKVVVLYRSPAGSAWGNSAEGHWWLTNQLPHTQQPQLIGPSGTAYSPSEWERFSDLSPETCTIEFAVPRRAGADHA